MGGRTDNPVRTLRVRKGDDLKTIYAKARRAFTAADLQRYTDLRKEIPAEQVLKELDAIHREETRKLRKKRRRT